MASRKARKSSGRRSRKPTSKIPSNTSKENLNSIKAVVLASETNLESKSKSVSSRQSRYCAICKKNFFSKQLLHEHNIEYHSFHHCPNCPKSYRQTRKFILHLRSHLEDHPYECKICLESFNQKRDLLAHKGVHRNSSNLGCDVCPEVFPHLASLNRHRLAHSGPPYPCDLCGAVFSNVPDRTVHSKNHVHRCFMCPKEVVAFPSNVKLAIHMYKVHRPEKYDPAEMDTVEPCVSTGAVNLDDGDTDSMDEFDPSDDDSDADVDDNYRKDSVESVYNLKRRDKFICFICYDLYPTSELLKSHMTAHNWYPCNSCPQFFPDAETFKKHKCNFSEVSISRCKDCNFECENCLLNRKIVVNAASMSRLQSIAARYPDLVTYGITDYSDVAQRNLLINFIKDIKSEEEPFDVETFNLIGAHNANLKIILYNPAVRCLFPRDCIPDLEDLYSKFQNLSKIVVNRVNCSSTK